jgi:hypothetical protein
MDEVKLLRLIRQMRPDGKMPQSAVLREFPERYSGEAEDFLEAWAEFEAAGGRASPHFGLFCARKARLKAPSAAKTWFERRLRLTTH